MSGLYREEQLGEGQPKPWFMVEGRLGWQGTGLDLGILGEPDSQGLLCYVSRHLSLLSPGLRPKGDGCAMSTLCLP